jgi:hypothetical protein
MRAQQPEDDRPAAPRPPDGPQQPLRLRVAVLAAPPGARPIDELHDRHPARPRDPLQRGALRSGLPQLSAHHRVPVRTDLGRELRLREPEAGSQESDPGGKG